MKFLKVTTITAIIISLSILVTGCATTTTGEGGYRFGNISKNYCSSTDPIFRQGIRKILAMKGIVVGTDYCASLELIDMMLHNE